MITKQQIYNIVKRSSHIHYMIKHNIQKKVLHIGDTVETLEINDNVRIVLSIEDEIIQAEETQWLKEVFAGIRAGEKDIALISNYPVARTKFYDVKNEFINKIYNICIFKGLVSYEDILKNPTH